MASRKTRAKKRPASTGLVPVLRDAVSVVDRALAELGRTPRPRKPRKPRKPRARGKTPKP
jgi:hypothetical protein